MTSTKKINIIILIIFIFYSFNSFGEIIKLRCECVSVYGKLINQDGIYESDINCSDTDFKKINYLTLDYDKNLLDSVLPPFKNEKIFVSENFIKTKPINPLKLPEGFSYYISIDRKNGELQTREYAKFKVTSETPSQFTRTARFECEVNEEDNKF